MILELNDAGEILIPAELVQSNPHTRIQAERNGESLVLKPVVEEVAPPEGRFSDRLPTFPGMIADPNDTFRREDMYGDDGR
jgi:hypothetical protein